MNRTIYQKRFSFSIMLLLVVSRLTVQAQNQTLTQIRQQFETYRSQTLQEKLFLHTDRSLYLAGEVMWFRFYYVDGTLHRPLDVSRVAYLEVLDKDQKAVLQTKIALSTGKGVGSLLLPTSLNSGHYVVRAYTSWMKTSNPEYLFEKPITIVSTYRKLGLSVPVDSLAYSAQFFPEGGNLVNGLPAKVAFHVVDRQTGKGIDCRGALLTPTNDTVARFTSLRFGMGTFSFTPTAGTAYRVMLKDRRGRVLIRPLPAVYEYGYTMRVENLGDNQLTVTVRAKESPATVSHSAVYLIAHTRQSVKVAEMNHLQAGQTTFVIPKASLGEGISHLTVFSAAAQPVCERLYFKRPQSDLAIQIKPDNEQYAPRTKVTLDLTASSSAGTAAVTDLSVSVYRIDSLQTDKTNSLPAYLWLTSDLRGTVESPDYYLTQTGPEADAATDNLMLTHGWRRFRWESVLKPSPLPVGSVPEHRGPIIRGRVTDSRTGAPVAGVKTYLSLPGKGVQVYNARSDQQGMVWFETDHFYGTHDIVMQTIPSDSTYQVEIINPYTETAATTALPLFDLSATMGDQLRVRNLAMQVQNRYYTQYITPTQPIQSDSSTVYGRPDEHYLLDAYTRFTVLEEVLSEYVPGVRVFRRNKHFELRVNNLPYLQFFTEEPLILLDGVPITDTDRLMAFSPLKIKSLDVVSRRYFLGQSLLSGIISFRTYKDDLAGFQLDPRAVVLEYDGLQEKREFYVPAYATTNQTTSHLPDFRNLLYWNQQVTTDARGHTLLTFYTSDQEGTYQIEAHGLTTAGRAGSSWQKVVVRHLLK